MYNHAFTKNPFINHSSSPFARFPDISSSTSPPPDGNQFTSWLQPSAGSNMSGSYQDPSMYQQQQQQQQQPPSYEQSSYLGGSSLAPQPTGFQPTSSFGQQLVSNLSGSSYGYLRGQTPQAQQAPQTTTYQPAQQQLQSPTYVAQLDPYAPIGHGWDGSSPLPQQQHQQAQQPQSPYGTTNIQTPTGSSGTSTSTTPYSSMGEPHPREYVRTHKTEIEAWDSYAWKQLLNAFDALKDAWERRAKEAEQRVQQLQAQMQYAGYYVGQYQQEIGRIQELVKEARLFSDSVAASAFQMREAFQGYRQSGDLASKRRVREATNAALKGLPDWPTQIL